MASPPAVLTPPTLLNTSALRTPRVLLPLAATAAVFALLFANPAVGLAQDWWNDPEAGHGLLLAPLAIWLAVRAPRVEARPNLVLGCVMLLGAVVLRWVGGIAAEFFTMRVSMLVAVAALVVVHSGVRQVLAWWLPFTLLALSIPLPQVVLGTLALPLQLVASKLGAAMLEARHVPVALAGNVIRIPGRELFVTEACSGLRSLTALLSLGVLLGAMVLRHPASRAAFLLLALPVAIVVNAIRVFITGFLVHFVDPALGDGFLHLSQGWLLFVISFGLLGAIALVGGRLERRFGVRGRTHV